MAVKYPKLIRRASECGPFVVESQLKRGFSILEGLNEGLLLKATVVAFVKVDSPEQIKSQFLDYYRVIGVDFIFFIVNLDQVEVATLQGGEIFRDQRVAVATFTQIKNAGLDFCVSQLAQKYCTGKWVLFCNQYEYFFYPYCDTRSLKDLFAYQDSLKEKSLGALTIDCICSHDLSILASSPGAFCDSDTFFISSGYAIRRDPLSDTFACIAAHREIFGHHDLPRDIASTAAAKWSRHYFTIKAAKRLKPKQRNHVYASSKVHAAFLSLEFWIKSGGLSAFSSEQQHLIEAHSKRLTHWSNLVELGLMNLGEWSL